MIPFRPTAALYQNVQGCHGSPYIGRYSDRKLAGTKYLGVAINWQEPFDPPDYGCPGAWYRTPFIDSLDRYRRPRDDHGGRVHNPMFDSADWQIQGLVMFLEKEEERAHDYSMKVMHERSRAESEAAAAEAKSGRGAMRVRGRQAQRGRR